MAKRLNRWQYQDAHNRAFLIAHGQVQKHVPSIFADALGAEHRLLILRTAPQVNSIAEQAKDLVTRAIKSAISRDSMSGDGVDFLIITKDGIKEESIKF